MSFHNDVRADLAAIKAADARAHARLTALLAQLKADARLADQLLDHGYGKERDKSYSVSKWIDRWKRGVDLWRLKSWSSSGMG